MSYRVLITGGSSGIGFELAKIFASKGYDLVLVSREKAPKADEFKNVSVIQIGQDLSKPGSAKKLAEKLSKQKISVDMLVNNAGFGDYALFKDANIDKLASMMQLNMNTLTELTHLLLPDIVKSKNGKIMNTASTAAFLPGPYMAVYYATKHYVLAFSEALAEELSGEGVSVTALCPGPTSSNFAKQAHASRSKLFAGSLATSADVAKFGYDSMMAGKRVAVHGGQNKINTFLPRLLPKSLVTRIVAKASGEK